MSKKSPKRIWLQWSPDIDGTDLVTWCQHQIDDTDPEYIRADLHQAALDRIAALEALVEAARAVSDGAWRNSQALRDALPDGVIDALDDALRALTGEGK